MTTRIQFWCRRRREKECLFAVYPGKPQYITLLIMPKFNLTRCQTAYGATCLNLNTHISPSRFCVPLFHSHCRINEKSFVSLLFYPSPELNPLENNIRSPINTAANVDGISLIYSILKTAYSIYSQLVKKLYRSISNRENKLENHVYKNRFYSQLYMGENIRFQPIKCETHCFENVLHAR